MPQIFCKNTEKKQYEKIIQRFVALIYGIGVNIKI